MCLLFESIKVENRKLHNLKYHNERLNRSRFELLGCTDEIDLFETIHLPNNLSNEIYKCRVVYNKSIQTIEFDLYKQRKIEKLILVESDIDYSYKYDNRSEINQLTNDLKPNEDILIIKDGFVTDCSFANVCFWDGKEWFTPDTPILKGSKRQKLLDEGKIIEKTIHKEDINNFQKVSLINGMMELGDFSSSISRILF